MKSHTQSIHIVRRYGKYGGMERYVWELTRALVASGHKVKVICDVIDKEIEEECALLGIQVISLAVLFRGRPRWIFMLWFAYKVERALSGLNTKGWIIHSHERTRTHNVTTFHSGSIRSRNRSVFDVLSLRLQTWEKLERRELLGINVRKIFPVSDIVRTTLLRHYPECASTLMTPIYPGVGDEFVPCRRETNGKTLGFIGVEWKRKGLDKLATTVAEMREVDPDVQLVVAGCAPDQIKHLFQGWDGGYQLLNWVDAMEFYAKIDALVLPSRDEAFGMAAAEANATGIPVVVSTHCGIAPLVSEEMGRVVDISSDGALYDACMAVLGFKHEPVKMHLRWSEIADTYAEHYRQIVNA